MARYDLFEAGFNNFEETINFGRRAGGDSEGLYEICTLAVIRSSEQLSAPNELQITSYYEVDGRIFFAINNCLRIVKSVCHPEQLSAFEYDYFVDNIAVSPCGIFVLICTRDGEISIRDISSIVEGNNEPVIIEGDGEIEETNIKGEKALVYECPLVFKEKIDCCFDNGQKCFIAAFVDASFGPLTFYVVTSKGLVKKISANPNENDGPRFVSSVLSDLKRNVKICSFAYPFICLEGQALLILDLRSGNCEVDDAIGIKSLLPIGHNFLAFDNQGNVFMIDSTTCLIFGLNDKLPHFVDAYDKLLAFADGDKRFILGITKSEPKIQLLSFPEGNIIYELPLTDPVHLTNMKGFTEEVLFLSEVRKNTVLSEIRLQYVTETDPELRVRRLVQKGLLEKAEVFAKTFNVDREFLAKVKAEHIMEKLECTTEDINELLNILETINDHSFRMTCCDSVTCKTAADTRRVLCHGAFMDIDVRDCRENNSDPLLFMKRKFNRILHRLDTYTQVYPVYNRWKWRYYADSDLIDEVKMFLRQGLVEEATLIYSRLDHYEIASITNEKIKEVTAMVNPSLKMTTKFLNTFIPLTLKFKPDALGIFVDWIHDRVYQLEKESDSNFPDCAIRYLEDMTNLLNMYIPAQSLLGDESRDVLTNLLNALKSMQTLANNFFIKLPLSQYLSAPNDIVGTLLNVDLEPKYLELLMNEFLYPFMLKCGVDIDTLLIEEIKALFIYDEEYWVNVVHVLLKFVTRVEEKLETIKEILKIATKPWSDKVRDIARMTFEHTSTNPIAKEIVELLRDEHILIVFQKYKINKNQFSSWTDKSFYLHRILYLKRDDCEEAIEDIHQLCRDGDDRSQADLLMIREFIKRGDTEKAMMLMDKQEPQNMCLFGEQLLDEILFMGEKDMVPLQFRQAYQAALNPLWNRLEGCSKGKEMENIRCSYNIANAVYGISSLLGVKIDRFMLLPKEVDNTLNVLFRQVTDLISEADILSFEKLIRICKKLSHFVGQSLDSILFKFMTIKDNFSLLLSIGKYLLEESQCPELLTRSAVYLFKYSKVNFSDAGNETFLDVVVAVNKSNPDDDLEAVQLARKLCVKALTSSRGVDEMPILEVLQWIDSCYYLSNMGEHLHFHAELNNIYLPKSALYFGISFEPIISMVNTFGAFAESLREGNFKHLTYFKSDEPVALDEFQRELEQFLWNIRALLKQDHYLTAFRMIVIVQRSCLYFPNLQQQVLKPLQQFMLDTVLPHFIEAVMSHNHVDKSLLLELMLLFGKNNYEEQLSKYLTVYKRRPNKLNVITQVGLNLLSHHGVTHGKQDLLKILNLCKWWFRTNDPQKMKYESYFTNMPEKRLEMLIKYEKVTIENLPEYCTDFGLDLQHSYLKYLKIILLNWQPEVEYVTDVEGKKNIVITNSEAELTSKCSQILVYISNKKDVFKLTEQIWPLVNFYYYEVYLVILWIHFQVSTSGSIPAAYRPLLYFLKTYKRVSSPTRTEIEQWYGTFTSKALIDPLSEFRLPLTSTFLSTDIWNIIKQEVNLDTYKEWFKLATILNQYLNQQDICTYAINSPVSSGLINSASNVWELRLKYDHLLPKVDECARNISDLERATAAVYTLMCGMPPGADKVQMAELSYKYAQLYRDVKTDDDVEKVYLKVKQRYLNYSAIHILHKYQLADDRYLEQVAQPSDLIWELYNDPRIEIYFDNLIYQCPDINKAVEELANLFGLNIKRERFGVLLQFLKSNSTLDLDFATLPGNEYTHLKRACYLCKSHDLQQWQKFLIEQGTKVSVGNDMQLKANALRCFYYISDRDTVEEMCEMSYEGFVNYLAKVSVIAKMSDLGLKFETVAQLDEQNQKGILKKLAKCNDPLAIKCIASLCKIYELDDLKYWEYIVNNAIQFHMLRELRDYLEFLRDRCVSDCIKKAWNVILFDVFNNLTSSELSDSEICLLLQTCPVIFELDLEPFIQKCMISERPDIATILRQFKKEVKTDWIQIGKATEDNS